MRKGYFTPKALTGALLAICLALVSFSLSARDDAGSHGELRRYVIEFQDQPLAAYDGRRLSVAAEDGSERLEATQTEAAKLRKLDLRSQRARKYRGFLDGRQQAFDQEARRLLRRNVSPVHRYRFATNGVAMDLTGDEAEKLAASPGVKSVRLDEHHRLHTFAGPKWIGAEEIWNGDAGPAPARGEQVIIGVIDSGINWDSPSFANPSADGYTHNNPLGQSLGLCATGEAQCNGKIIGVWDFIEDNPGTTDIVEENTNGRDNDGHGSHTASIAAGNPVMRPLASGVNATISGAAPRANIVAYRVCYIGEPVDPEGGGCPGSAILAAIDQAVVDGVDVINYSIGSVAYNPWINGTVARAFLNARAAGIFVATSAGNEGPGESTIGSPANAPWTTAVGYATHNTAIGSLVQDLAGGAGAAPPDLLGASRTQGIGVRRIVHARDYGNALCGVGEAELQETCNQNTGASNPWAGETPFNGEIVVCDRGTYGRVEKSKNVSLAGAGGFILANTSEFGGSLNADNHCLPASHIGSANGDLLRNWLATGSGHQGSISGARLVEVDLLADQISAGSSRGPADIPVEDLLKPNLIAPGTSILAAWNGDPEYAIASGSSMSSPHVAGAGALLMAAQPDWNVSQVASALETTATDELATDRGLDAATPHQAGAGRPQLGDAVDAGLYLEISESDFLAENPSVGGEPRNLNLPSMSNANCNVSCSFTRTLTDQVGGASWTATPVGFPAGATVRVAPVNFSLDDGQSQDIDVTIEVDSSGLVNSWVSGKIRLSAIGLPDQFLTVIVLANGGELPEKWTVSTTSDGNWAEFRIGGLLAMPDATFSGGGLVKPNETTQKLITDPSRDDPYDNEEGTFTVWHSLPEGGLWLHARTLDTTATDLDLYVGRDSNGNGIPELFEELCSSTTPDVFETCDLFDLEPGDYWIRVQNWDGTIGGDDVSLIHAAIPGGGNLSASGPGITTDREFFPVRVAWDNFNAKPGETWLGAVGIGSSRSTPLNMGVIPVHLTRSAVASAQTFPLMNGETHGLALDGNGVHDRLFIDVPPGTSRLDIFAAGANAAENDQLRIELKRLDFGQALADPPFTAPAAGAATVVSSDGSGGNGPSITVVGVDAGRWYPVLVNRGDTPVSARIRAVVSSGGSPVPVHQGLWAPTSRPDIRQGYEYNLSGTNRALIWYTFDEAGQPEWYIATGAAPAGDIWVADLLRVTNNGAAQQLAPVGMVSVTTLAEDDALFSFTLFGRSGTERMMPISAHTCPQTGGAEHDYTGVWFRGEEGLGGASVLVNATSQGQVHYVFDDQGRPRWLLTRETGSPSPFNEELSLVQFSGHCAVCEETEPAFETVGMLNRSFSSDTEGSWTLDYVLAQPLPGSVQRTENIFKLTDPPGCD